MGVDLFIKKGKESIWFGRKYQTFEHTDDIETEIEDTLDYISKLKANINSYVAYSPKNVEDLNTVMTEISGDMEELTKSCEKLGRLYLIRDNLDDGWKIENDA